MYRLNIMTWNCNGLNNKQDLLLEFLYKETIDICMLQETHEKLNIDYCICQFRGYKVYTTRSSSKNAYGGTAILIKNNIRHSWLGGFSGPEHQTTVINISTVRGCIKLTSCYIHYKAKVNEDFFKRLLPVETDKYIIAGDFNAKHSDWGCNINTPRGNLMSKVIKSNGLEIISPREPTRNLSSDVLDFAISNHKFDISSVRVIDDLSSDHLPVIIHLNTDIIQRLSYEPGNNSRDPCDVCQVKELVEMENHLKQKMSPARVENLKKKFMGKQKRRPKRRKLQRSNSWREEQEVRQAWEPEILITRPTGKFSYEDIEVSTSDSESFI